VIHAHIVAEAGDHLVEANCTSRLQQRSMPATQDDPRRIDVIGK